MTNKLKEAVLNDLKKRKFDILQAIFTIQPMASNEQEYSGLAMDCAEETVIALEKAYLSVIKLQDAVSRITITSK